MESPCRTCADLNSNKKLDHCENCEKRINYAREEGMIPKEEKTRPWERAGKTIYDSVVKNIKDDIQVVRKDVGLPAKRGRPPEPETEEEKEILIKETKPKAVKTKKKSPSKQLKINVYYPKELIDDYKQVTDDLKYIAKKELRSINSQLFFFVREGIERYKKSNCGRED